MITYDVFWVTLKKRKVSQYKLVKEYDISKGTLHRMKNNGSISTYTVNRLCNILQCDITEIMTFTSENKLEEELE